MAGRYSGFLALALLCLATPALRAEVIYSNDFSVSAGANWSNGSLDASPSGQQFLGRFGNESTTLTLSGLSAHTDVSVSFDLYLVGTWDGVHAAFGGPDAIKVTADGGTLLHSSFSNIDIPAWKQNYPNPIGGGTNPAFTGAHDINALGYALDSIYRFTFDFEHSASTLSISFTGSGLQEGFGVFRLTDESWGIDNVSVEAFNGAIAEVPEPGTLALGLMGAAGAIWTWRRRQQPA